MECCSPSHISPLNAKFNEMWCGFRVFRFIMNIKSSFKEILALYRKYYTTQRTWSHLRTLAAVLLIVGSSVAGCTTTLFHTMPFIGVWFRTGNCLNPIRTACAVWHIISISICGAANEPTEKKTLACEWIEMLHKTIEPNLRFTYAAVFFSSLVQRRGRRNAPLDGMLSVHLCRYLYTYTQSACTYTLWRPYKFAKQRA